MQESNTPDNVEQPSEAPPTDNAATMTQTETPVETPIAPPVAAASTSGGSALSITAFVLGLVALVFAFIPGLSFAAWLPAIGAIVFGIIALAKKSGKRGLAISGLILGPIGWLIAIIVSVGAVFGAAGSAVSDSVTEGFESTTQEDEESAVDESADEAPADSELGTRANPAPAGSTIEIGDFGSTEWEVTLGEAVLNANKVIANENQFNDAPEPGFQYLLVPVTYTYLGDDSATPWIDVTIEFVSAAGTTHTTSDAFVVEPDGVHDINELYTGASATGNIVIMVPSDDVEAGTWSVSSWFGDPIFVKVV